MDVYIIYGSETGNAQQLAERCSSRLNELGISPLSIQLPNKCCLP